MKTILIYDCETTGLEPQTDRVIEAAGALWSIPLRTLIASFSFVIRAEENPVEHVNRIPAAVLQAHGLSPDEAEKRIAAWISRAEAIVAHNSDFDAGFLPNAIRDLRPWIDSKADIEWPRGGMGKGLRDLAIEHDVGIVRAHRALADVDILVRLFERAAELGADIEAMLIRALRPKARFVADLPRSRNDELKAAGFRWDNDRKQWWRKMAIADVGTLPFPVREAP